MSCFSLFSLASGVLHRQKELKLRRQLVLAIQAVRKVNAPHSAVGVNLHSQSLYVVRAVSSTGEIREIELNLIPALIQSHGHGADERLHARRGLWLVSMRAGDEADCDESKLT
jgi:hypothetical protein